MANRWQRGRNDSGSLLASVFIMTLGAGGCLFTVSAMAPQSMPIAVWTISGLFSVFLLLILLQRFGKVPQTDIRFLLSSRKNTRDDGRMDYQPRKANDLYSGQSGTNLPISAAEAHEIQITSANTWVPAQTRGERRK